MKTVRSGFDLDPRTSPPATKMITLVLFITGVAFSFTDRNFGFGTSTFYFSPERIVGSLEVWRLLTYPFVYDSVFSLLLGLFVFYLIARQFEQMWGTKDFVQFTAVSAVGAALIALPLHFAINILGLFSDTGGVGIRAVTDALFGALALIAGDSNVLFGFMLPMRARSLVYLLIGMEVVVGLMSGAASLSLTLGGLAMGYLLVSGNWRPSRWKLGALKKRPPRRRGLYVVPPRDDKTLH